jgi:M6 family metalloprotease-like protein
MTGIVQMRSILGVGLLWLGAFPVGAQAPCVVHQAAAKTAAVLQSDRLPRRGAVDALVVYAQFAGEGSQDLPAYSTDFFDPDLPGSLAHFYRTMSFEQLQLGGTVAPRRYSAAQSAAAYSATEPGALGDHARFAAEVLAQVDEDMDFRLYDNDGPDGLPDSGDDDGIVDYVFINMRTVPTGFLVGNASGLAGLAYGQQVLYQSDDISVVSKVPIRVAGGLSGGSFVAEGNWGQTVGIMAHEFGHGLGLPDLFDVSRNRNPDEDPSEDSAGIGRWGLMGWGATGWAGASGPVAFSAWSLEQLGWLGPDNQRLEEVVGDRPDLLVADLHRGGTVYKVPLRAWTPDSLTLWREYVLLEYRSRQGNYYHRDLPGEGLLVWYVRPQAEDNQDEMAKRLDLVCADGLWADAGFPDGATVDPHGGRDNLDFWAADAAYSQAHGGNLGDATDPFDGVRYRRLAFDSNPSTLDAPVAGLATTGLALEQMRPAAGGLRLSLRQPRWAGIINDEVHWAGTVLVDGDLTVGPTGRLVLARDTRVLVEGSDRLAEGMDVTKSEIRIEGDLVLRELSVSQLSFVQRDFVRDDTTSFAARVPDQTWAGLFIQPGPDAELVLPHNGYTIRDSESGLVVFDGLPPDSSSVRFDGFQFMRDASDPNGNGHLDPGESVRLVPELTNLSPLFFFTSVQAHLSWNSPFLRPSSGNTRTRTINVPPGRKQAFLFRSVVEVVEEAQSGDMIQFDVSLTKNGGEPVWTGQIEVEISPANTAVLADGSQPAAFVLEENYPNPFNAETRIGFSVPQTGPVQLTVFNAAGQSVRRLVHEGRLAGVHQVHWDGTDDGGQAVGSGVYLYRLEAGGRQQVRRLVLLK